MHVTIHIDKCIYHQHIYANDILCVIELNSQATDRINLNEILYLSTLLSVLTLLICEAAYHQMRRKK